MKKESKPFAIDIIGREFAKLVQALEEIEGLSTDDFEKGGFLCKELPADYRDLWIMETKEIARKALNLNDQKGE